jgi:hypothetical protein
MPTSWRQGTGPYPNLRAVGGPSPLTTSGSNPNLNPNPPPQPAPCTPSPHPTPAILEVWGAVVQPPYIYVVFERGNEAHALTHIGEDPLALRVARDMAKCAAHLVTLGRDMSSLALEDFLLVGQANPKPNPK